MDLYTGKTALVTGASSGIGTAFAKALAAKGSHLILVARSEEKLRTLARQLEQQHGIRAEVIVADLSRVGIARTIFEETQQRGLTVDILINNAGFATYGPFETLDAEREQQEIRVDVNTLVDLTHAFVPAMLTRHQGAIINVASIVAFLPGPYAAVYAASKAFVLSFSESLWGEYREKGVRVLALCPGATSTDFFRTSDSQHVIPENVETPERVVRVALLALEQGRPSVVSGWQNALLTSMPRFLPRGITVRLAVRAIQQSEQRAARARMVSQASSAK
jgi:short-subunit dehydrogenase